MSPNTKIVVERGARLNLAAGGHISTCGDSWKGIRVRGNSSLAQSNVINTGGNLAIPLPDESGFVLIFGGTISNAEVAVSDVDYDLANPEEFYGMHVSATNGIFQDNWRDLEFSKYTHVTTLTNPGGLPISTPTAIQNSTFTDCDFFSANPGSLNESVVIDQNNTITFEGCTWTGYNDSALKVFNGSVDVVNGNSFDNCETGVELNLTYPSLFIGDTQIGALSGTPNDFNCYRNGVLSSSYGYNSEVLIRNNNFNGGQFGAFMSGQGSFQITNNDFGGGLQNCTRIISTSGATNVNLVRENEFEDSQTASQAVWNNSSLTYLDHCMTNIAGEDIFLNHTEIFPFQGSGIIEAGNCFSQADLDKRIRSYQSAPITYFLLNQDPSSCEYIDEILNVINTESSSNGVNANCVQILLLMILQICFLVRYQIILETYMEPLIM